MIQPAIKYESKLRDLFIDTWSDIKYKFWHTNYNIIPKIDNTTYSSIEFVSIDNENNIIGFMTFSIDRDNYYVSGVGAINFTNKKVIFGRDLFKAMKNLFDIHNFRKINFSMVVGNPIEKMYDKFIKIYGGRIVGVKRDDILINGIYYDRKIYEITKNEYENNK